MWECGREAGEKLGRGRASEQQPDRTRDWLQRPGQACARWRLLLALPTATRFPAAPPACGRLSGWSLGRAVLVCVERLVEWAVGAASCGRPCSAVSCAAWRSKGGARAARLGLRLPKGGQSARASGRPPTGRWCKLPSCGREPLAAPCVRVLGAGADTHFGGGVAGRPAKSSGEGGHPSSSPRKNAENNWIRLLKQSNPLGGNSQSSFPSGLGMPQATDPPSSVRMKVAGGPELIKFGMDPCRPGHRRPL